MTGYTSFRRPWFLADACALTGSIWILLPRLPTTDFRFISIGCGAKNRSSARQFLLLAVGRRAPKSTWLAA